ncbi:MAG: 1,4-dihydroxy-6-naphthoate synthase [Saprospiraceae bacterium]
MRLTLGFSPCPNDTFLFFALVNRLLEDKEFEWDIRMADVEQLNEWAENGELDVTKMSFNAYPTVSDKYKILNAGSALGNRCGPLLIAKNQFPLDEIAQKKIALPGERTTAHFLFQFAFPEATNKEFLVFNEIEAAVINGEADAGVIIHENRFTYADRGLVCLQDLGENWETKTGFPIPLGCIAIRRELASGIQHKVDMLIRDSLDYAYNREAAAMEYVSRWAQEMDPKVMQQHIDLYVSKYTRDLGAEGKAAVMRMFQQGSHASELGDADWIFV